MQDLSPISERLERLDVRMIVVAQQELPLDCPQKLGKRPVRFLREHSSWQVPYFQYGGSQEKNVPRLSSRGIRSEKSSEKISMCLNRS